MNYIHSDVTYPNIGTLLGVLIFVLTCHARESLALSKEARLFGAIYRPFMVTNIELVDSKSSQMSGMTSRKLVILKYSLGFGWG